MPFPAFKSRGPKMSADAQPRHSVHTTCTGSAMPTLRLHTNAAHCAVLVQVFDDQ